MLTSLVYWRQFEGADPGIPWHGLTLKAGLGLPQYSMRVASQLDYDATQKVFNATGAVEKLINKDTSLKLKVKDSGDTDLALTT